MRSWREVGGRAFRAGMSLFLLFHLTAMTLSLGRDVESSDDLRATLTRTYEKTIGVHQNWTMFVPNPGMSTIWLEATGFRGAETSRSRRCSASRIRTDDLALRAGEQVRAEPRGQGAQGDACGMVRWLCANAKEAGAPYTEIEFSRRASRRPSRRKRAAAGPRETWPIERTRLERWRCKP
jgi:hypothetical protein